MGTRNSPCGATEAVIRPLCCLCHATLEAWLRVHSSIRAASLLVTASCCNASDDNRRFSLRNGVRNGAGNFIVDHGQHRLFHVFAAASLCHASEDKIGAQIILFRVIGLILQPADPTLELVNSSLAVGQLSEQPIYLGSLRIDLIRQSLGVERFLQLANDRVIVQQFYDQC